MRYGTTSPETLVEDLTPSTSHTVQLTGLDECTSYVFEASSTSPGCYEVAGNGIGSAPHRFTTLQGVEVL